MKTLWIFDNDGTLYEDCLVGEYFSKILYEYLVKAYSFNLDEIPEKLKLLKLKWKTEFSIMALVREYNMDFHDLVNNTYLKINLASCGVQTPDNHRFGILNSLKGKKIVFTNNPSSFAKYTLDYVQLSNCFSDFVGMEEMSFLGKPHPSCYRKIEDLYPGFDRIIFCDDSLKNLDAAKEFGWTTVWFNDKRKETNANFGHSMISSFEELKSF